MHRVIIDPKAVDASQVSVEDPAQIHHLVTVLRVQEGDPIECIDGCGGGYRGTVASCGPGKLVVSIAERFSSPPGVCRLVLACALIRAERFDWMVQKATELGVNEIVPLRTRRTVVKLSDARALAKTSRWGRIAAEAAKQCRRADIPTVGAVRDFENFLDEVSGAKVLMPTLEVPGRRLDSLAGSIGIGDRVILMIGPEGDFSSEEVDLAKRRDAIPISLGRLTLRTETAAVAGITIIRYMVRDL